MVPISILGVACHVPDAGSPDAFWTNLRSGHGSIRHATERDWGIDPATVIDPRPGTVDRVSSSAMAGAAALDFSGEGFCVPATAFAGMDRDFTWPLHVCREALIDAGLQPDVRNERCGLILGHYAWAITPATAALTRPLYERAISRALGRAGSEIGLVSPRISREPQAARRGLLSSAIVAALARAFGLGGPATRCSSPTDCRRCGRCRWRCRAGH
jgi:acyl transferase domain-containing protein